MITELAENQVFVFGSNLGGKHIAGAAKQALEQFGAIEGIGKGLQGKSFAFPTLDKNFNKLSHKRLRTSVYYLYTSCYKNPDKEFLLTKVGCGIAGFEEGLMKKLFTNVPSNLVLPEDWK